MLDWFSIVSGLEPHPDDDLERLFHRLPQLEPSQEVMERLFAAVRRLPGPLQQACQVPQWWKKEEHPPSGYYTHCEPC